MMGFLFMPLVNIAECREKSICFNRNRSVKLNDPSGGLVGALRNVPAIPSRLRSGGAARQRPKSGGGAQSQSERDLAATQEAGRGDGHCPVREIRQERRSD